MMNFLKKSKLDIIILQLGVSLLFFLLYSGFNYEILYFVNFYLSKKTPAIQG